MSAWVSSVSTWWHCSTLTEVSLLAPLGGGDSQSWPGLEGLARGGCALTGVPAPDAPGLETSSLVTSCSVLPQAEESVAMDCNRKRSQSKPLLLCVCPTMANQHSHRARLTNTNTARSLWTVTKYSALWRAKRPWGSSHSGAIRQQMTQAGHLACGLQ